MVTGAGYTGHIICGQPSSSCGAKRLAQLLPRNVQLGSRCHLELKGMRKGRSPRWLRFAMNVAAAFGCDWLYVVVSHAERKKAAPVE